MLSIQELRSFLDEKSSLYNHPRFIELDPILIPHQFSEKEDVEIAGFLTATISWGNRKAIIKGAHKMMNLMGNAPYDFIMSHREADLEKIGFVYRTFNSIDFVFFLKALRNIYSEKGGLEGLFTTYQGPDSLQIAIHDLKREFFSIPHPARTRKHLPDPLSGSAAKRINMFIRSIKVAC